MSTPGHPLYFSIDTAEKWANPQGIHLYKTFLNNPLDEGLYRSSNVENKPNIKELKGYRTLVSMIQSNEVSIAY